MCAEPGQRAPHPTPPQFHSEDMYPPELGLTFAEIAAAFREQFVEKMKVLLFSAS